MNDDERALRDVIDRDYEPYEVIRVQDLAADIGMHPKRVEYLAEKWADQGWYEYGVSSLLGWKCPQETIAHG